jgi:hypothetical protein
MAVPWAAIIGGALGVIGSVTSSRNSKPNNSVPYQHEVSQTDHLNEPWHPAKPHLTRALDMAWADTSHDLKRYNKGRLRYPKRPELSSGGYRRSGSSSLTNSLVDDIAQRARDGEPLVDSASDYINKSLSGEVPQNRYFDSAFKRLSNPSSSGGRGRLREFMNRGFGGDLDPSSGDYRRFLDHQWDRMGSRDENETTLGSRGNDRIRNYGNFTGGGIGTTVDGKTVLPKGGHFDKYIDEIFNPNFVGQNNPGISGVLDDVRYQSNRAFDDANQRLSARAEGQGAGMLGSSFYKRKFADAQAERERELSAATSRVLSDNYERRMADRMSALGMVNQRDLARMSDATSRLGISSNSAAAAAANRIARENFLDDLSFRKGVHNDNTMLNTMAAYSGNALANNRLLNDAMGAALQDDQFRQATMADMGVRYGDWQSSNSQNALGSIPDIIDSSYSGYDRALGASQRRDAANAADAARYNAHRNQIAQQNWRNEVEAFKYDARVRDNIVDDYIRRVSGIGALGSGGRSYTVGQRGSRGVAGLGIPSNAVPNAPGGGGSGGGGIDDF